MTDQREFDGLDVAWIATDSLGQVALFTTGGQGQIPTTALASAESAEQDVLSIQETCDSQLLVSVPRPDSFIDFARRGFFAYDWTDVHCNSSQELAAYELQAKPTCPLHINGLPAALQAFAASTVLQHVTFGQPLISKSTLVGT
jgi:hypothetical protein